MEPWGEWKHMEAHRHMAWHTGRAGLVVRGQKPRLGSSFNMKANFPDSKGIPIVNVRQSWDRLCLYNGIPILISRHPCIKMAQCQCFKAHCNIFICKLFRYVFIGRTCRQPSFPRWGWVPGVLFLTSLWPQSGRADCRKKSNRKESNTGEVEKITGKKICKIDWIKYMHRF